MAVTGEIEIDFTGVSDVNPYVDALVVAVGNGVKVAGGAAKSPTSGGGFYTAATPTGTDIRSRITINGSNPAGDAVGPALINTSGDGYWLHSRTTTTRIYSVIGGVEGSQIGANTTVEAFAGDDTELRIDEATNTLTAYVNGTLIETFVDSTYTGVRGGIFSRFQNNNATGVAVWAADGYAVAAITLTGPDTVTEAVSTSTVGTLQDTVTTLSLATDDDAHSIEQTKGATTATSIAFTPNSGINDATVGTPADGIPLEADILSSGATAYQLVQVVV